MQIKLYFGRDSWNGISQVLECDSHMQGSRYADISGEDLAYIMPALNWHFVENTNNVGVLLYEENENAPIASASLNMMVHENEYGCNLTYATKQEYEGNGFAKIAAAICIQAFEEANKGKDLFLNLQYRQSNCRSGALAKKLGAQENSQLQTEIVTPKGNLITISTSRCSLEFAASYTRNIALDFIGQCDHQSQSHVKALEKANSPTFREEIMPQSTSAQKLIVNEPGFSMEEVAETLRSAASADIWYDAAQYGDEGPRAQIEQAQNAMEKVAQWLQTSNPTPALGSPSSPSLTKLQTQQVLTATQLALNALSQSAAEPGTKQGEIEDEATRALNEVLNNLPQPEHTTALRRVLITVSGGVADYACDDGIEVEIFDHDNYDDESDETSGVSAHFADLAEPLGIPVDTSTQSSQVKTHADAKTLAVLQLQQALSAATEAGLFDEMASIIHPDVINRFCDAVSDEFAARTHTEDTSDDAAPSPAGG